MLIYHNTDSASNIFNSKVKSKREKNTVKKKKKEYKSIDNRVPEFIHAQVSEQSCQKKSNSKALRKKLSKKNILFLTTLGLKVKQQQK